MQDTSQSTPKRLSEKLFSASKIEEYITILQKEDMIQYLSCKEFCKRIRQNVHNDKVEEFIKLFKKQTIFVKKINKNKNFHFPYMKNQHQQFMKVLLDVFIVEYLYDQVSQLDTGKPEDLWPFKYCDKDNQTKYGDNKGKNIHEQCLISSQQSSQDQFELSEQDSFIQQDSKSKIFSFDFERQVIESQVVKSQVVESQVVESKVIGQQQTQQKNNQQPLKKKNNFKNNFINPINDEKFTKMKIKCEEAEQDEKLLQIDPNIQDKAKIPSFFVQRSHAFSMLLQVNLTAQFTQELQEIKKMIELQIVQKTILPYYQKFFSQYLQFKSISQGDCEKNLIKKRQLISQSVNQIKNYWEKQNRIIKYLPGKRQSQFLKAWDSIYQQLKRLKTQEKFKSNVQKTQTHLLKGLNKIYLSFKYKINQKMIYGLTKSRNILINLNVKSKGLNFKQFIQGPLKPYIALTVYHELAHFLIRSFNFDQTQVSGYSFNFSHSTIGQTILNLFNYDSLEIPSYLKLSSTQTANANKSQSDIRKHASSMFDFLQNQSITIRIIQSLYAKIEKLVQKVQIIKSAVVKAISYQQGFTISQEQYQNLSQYINSLSKSNDQIIIDRQKQLKYSVFFSFFLIPRIFSRFLNKRQMDQAKYQKLCQMLLKPQVKRYFYTKNQVIQRFSSGFFKYLEQKSDKNPKKIKKRMEFLPLYRKFVNLMLKKKDYQINTINNQINHIFKQLCENQLKTYNDHLKILFKKTLRNFGSVFNQFQLKLFDSLDQQKLLQNFVDQVLDFNEIIDAYQSYEKIMNFIKYHQFIIISTQIPSFYTHNLYEKQNEDNLKKNKSKQSVRDKKKLEAGFDIERRLFPTLIKTQTIYAKDYRYMKTLNTQQSRKNIGKMPADQKDVNYSVLVMKHGRQIERGMTLRERVCGTQYYKYVKKLLEQRREQDQKQ